MQAAFAQKACSLLGISAGDALLQYTTFYWIAGDNDAGSPPDRWSFDPKHPRWTAFVEAISSGIDPVDYVYQHHLISMSKRQQMTCFEYDYWSDLSWVRLHFGNSPDGLGLRGESIARRRAELHEIFADVATNHPDATAVRGCSWLYHVPAYRRLFPVEFVDAMESVGHLHQFAALWGQFLDRHGKAKADLTREFLEQVEAAETFADLDGVFPLDVLAATCPIQVFYRHFGIKDDLATHAHRHFPIDDDGLG